MIRTRFEVKFCSDVSNASGANRLEALETKAGSGRTIAARTIGSASGPEDLESSWDDVRGGRLDLALVRKVRQDEVYEFHRHGVIDIVPRKQFQESQQSMCDVHGFGSTASRQQHFENQCHDCLTPIPPQAPENAATISASPILSGQFLARCRESLNVKEEPSHDLVAAHKTKLQRLDCHHSKIASHIPQD